MKIKPTPNYVLNCDICIQGKMSNNRNKTLDRKATKILTLVHSDLAGLIDGYKYVINFILGLQCYISKNRNPTLCSLQRNISLTSPLYGHVKFLRTDNRMEFTSEPFQRLLVLNRIKHERSAPYSPHQNAERSWRTLFFMCLLIESKLPKN